MLFHGYCILQFILSQAGGLDKKAILCYNMLLFRKNPADKFLKYRRPN